MDLLIDSPEEVLRKVCSSPAADMTEAFTRAAEEVKILKVRPDKKELTDLYGLFKQALEGDVSSARPGLLDFAGRVKWDAWNLKKGLTRDDAKHQYVQLVEKLKSKYGMEK